MLPHFFMNALKAAFCEAKCIVSVIFTITDIE